MVGNPYPARLSAEYDVQVLAEARVTEWIKPGYLQLMRSRFAQVDPQKAVADATMAVLSPIPDPRDRYLDAVNRQFWAQSCRKAQMNRIDPIDQPVTLGNCNKAVFGHRLS